LKDSISSRNSSASVAPTSQVVSGSAKPSAPASPSPTTISPQVSLVDVGDLKVTLHRATGLSSEEPSTDSGAAEASKQLTATFINLRISCNGVQGNFLVHKKILRKKHE
jgi:hypothetical protein